MKDSSARLKPKPDGQDSVEEADIRDVRKRDMPGNPLGPDDPQIPPDDLQTPARPSPH